MADKLNIADWQETTDGMVVLFGDGEGDAYPLTSSRMFDLYRIESAVNSPLAPVFYRLHLMLSGGQKADLESGDEEVEAVTPARLPNGDPAPATRRLLDLFASTYAQLHANHSDRRNLNIAPSAPYHVLEAARRGEPVNDQWLRKRHFPYATAQVALRERANKRRGRNP